MVKSKARLGDRYRPLRHATPRYATVRPTDLSANIGEFSVHISSLLVRTVTSVQSVLYIHNHHSCEKYYHCSILSASRRETSHPRSLHSRSLPAPPHSTVLWCASHPEPRGQPNTRPRILGVTDRCHTTCPSTSSQPTGLRSLVPAQRYLRWTRRTIPSRTRAVLRREHDFACLS